MTKINHIILDNLKSPRPLFSLLWLGLGLRLYNLTYHSLWFDEAISIRWAKESVPRILEVSMNLVEDRLPPFYYLLLKWWGDIAGLSEFSVRYPSVLFGVSLIAVIYALGRRLWGRGVGFLAGLLVALNPFLIWYSQEARMYSLAVLWGSLGVLCFVNACYPFLYTTASRPTTVAQVGWWTGFGVCALAGLYTHLYTGFLWPALALWLFLNPRLLRRVWWRFGFTMAIVTLLFLPLAWANWQFSGESAPGNPLSDISGRIVTLFQAFTFWQAAVEPQIAAGLSLLLGGLTILGLVFAVRKPAGRLISLLLLMPFFIASLLLLRSQLAFFGERYFIVMVPWLLLLQAVAVVRLWQWLWPTGTTTYTQFEPRRNLLRGGRMLVAILLLGLIVGGTAYPVPRVWRVEAAKEAWRQTVAFMTMHIGPTDAVFIHPEWVRFPYQYYEDRFKTPGQTYAAFFAVDAQTDLDGPLQGVVNNHPVVWLIQSHIDEPDPDRRVENWFAARYPLVTELYPPGVVLKAYAPGYQLETLPLQATAQNHSFATGLTLRGFQLFETELSPQEALFHPPSNWIHLTLYWSVAASQTDPPLPVVQLIGPNGGVWGASLERASDSLHLYPPTRWEPGQIIRHDVDVNLNPAAPAGDYRLVLKVGEESLVVGTIQLIINN